MKIYRKDFYWNHIEKSVEMLISRKDSLKARYRTVKMIQKDVSTELISFKFSDVRNQVKRENENISSKSTFKVSKLCCIRYYDSIYKWRDIQGHWLVFDKCKRGGDKKLHWAVVLNGLNQNCSVFLPRVSKAHSLKYIQRVYHVSEGGEGISIHSINILFYIIRKQVIETLRINRNFAGNFVYFVLFFQYTVNTFRIVKESYLFVDSYHPSSYCLVVAVAVLELPVRSWCRDRLDWRDFFELHLPRSDHPDGCRRR